MRVQANIQDALGCGCCSSGSGKEIPVYRGEGPDRERIGTAEVDFFAGTITMDIEGELWPRHIDVKVSLGDPDDFEPLLYRRGDNW